MLKVTDPGKALAFELDLSIKELEAQNKKRANLIKNVDRNKHELR
jgi:hypothetical protein